MVTAVEELMLELLPLVLSTYGSPSSLFFGEECHPVFWESTPSWAPALLPDNLQHGAAAVQWTELVLPGWMMALWEAAWMRSLLISGQWNKVHGSWVSSSTLRRRRSSVQRHQQGMQCCSMFLVCVWFSKKTPLCLTPQIGTLEGIQDTIRAKKTLAVLGDRLRRLQAPDALCLFYHTFAIPKFSMSFTPHHAFSPLNYRTLTPWSDPYCVHVPSWTSALNLPGPKHH